MSKEPNDDRGEWAAGVEFRIAANLWLSTGFGSQFSALDEPDRLTMLLNIRWATSSKSRLEGLRVADRVRRWIAAIQKVQGSSFHRVAPPASLPELTLTGGISGFRQANPQY